MSGRRRLVGGSVGVLAALAATLVSLDAFGRSRRSFGSVHELSDPAVQVVAVATADEAYREWRNRRLHGRVVLSLSSRLYFVPPPESSPARARDDGRPSNPSAVAEEALGPERFLLVAQETGVAREILHLLPRRTYAEKARYASGEEGVTIARGAISAPHLGSPRTLTTLDGSSLPAEPVLVFVSASFFDELGATDLLARLRGARLKTDLVVLCTSHDDAEVTSAQRQELAAFATLLGAR